MIITDQNKIKELLERGVEKIYPSKEKLEELLKSGKKLKLYCGFDPSAKALHIGNIVLVNKLAQFQAMGHQVVFLIGDFTGMIGDPTDKKAVRKSLTRKEVLENSKNYKKQASSFLNFKGENKAKLVYNSKWHDKLNFKDLIELSAHFTVQQMIQRDMFQERLKDEKPIYLHEFLYPLAQGYDSVALNVDLEVGGNDQMFNMMAGRDLMKSLEKKEKFVLTLKLLVDGQGNKMGKTTGNALFLDVDANNMYGIIMSWPDEVIALGFELCTKVSFSEVKNIQKELKENTINPRDVKMKLAWEITKLVHGEKLANQAQEYFKNTVQKKELPKEIIEIEVSDGTIILDSIVKYFSGKRSNSEIRRLFAGGGVSLNNQKVDNFKKKVKDEDIIKIGKRNWFKIKINYR